MFEVQRSNIERDKLINDGRTLGIDELLIIKQNENIIDNLKSKYKYIIKSMQFYHIF